MLFNVIELMKANWDRLCNDIARGVIDPDVRMPWELREDLAARLTPNRARADELRREFEKSFDSPIIPRIWPGFSAVIAIGTGGFSTYTRKMRRYTGKNIPFDNLTYAASESLMGAASGASRHLLVDIAENTVTLTNVLETNLPAVFTNLLTIIGTIFMMMITNVRLSLIFFIMMR